MIRTFHEAPKSIFRAVRTCTSGDYALCNVLESDPEYAELFAESRQRGREIILDNGAFELDHAVSAECLIKWANIIRPTWLVLPDVLDSCPETIRSAIDFIENYGKDIPFGTKLVGVVQGNSYEASKKCYQELDSLVDMIAFSFNAKWWIAPGVPYSSQLRLFADGRIGLLRRLLEEGVINKSKPHHLLGCSLPQEFLCQQYSWIYSVDTSNPVMWGLKYGVYPVEGPSTKPEGKLFEHMDVDLDYKQFQDGIRNILKFREWVGEDE